MNSNDNSNNNQDDATLPKKEGESNGFLHGNNNFDNRYTGIDSVQIGQSEQNNDLLPNLMAHQSSVQNSGNFYPQMNSTEQPSNTLVGGPFNANEPLSMQQAFEGDKNQELVISSHVNNMSKLNNNSVEIGMPQETTGQLQPQMTNLESFQPTLQSFQSIDVKDTGLQVFSGQNQDKGALQAQKTVSLSQFETNGAPLVAQNLKIQEPNSLQNQAKSKIAPKISPAKRNKQQENPEDNINKEMEESKESEDPIAFGSENEDDSDEDVMPPPGKPIKFDDNSGIDYEGQNLIILKQLKEEEAPLEKIITSKHFYKEMQKLKDKGTNAVPPKKHASAYIMFQKEKRPEILKRNPLAKVTEVVKEIAYCWGQMSKTDKQKYKDAAKRDKERYERELKHLHSFSKDLKKPKKCLSAYMIFVQETRPLIVKLNPQMGALQVMKQVGKAWQSMSDLQRQYFKNKADVDKVRYLKQMKEFYDEVERIGNRVGIVRSVDGIYNVSGGQPNQNKKALAKDKTINKQIQSHDMLISDPFAQINNSQHLFEQQANFMGQQQQQQRNFMFDQVNLELGQQMMGDNGSGLGLDKQAAFLGKRGNSSKNLLDNNLEMLNNNQNFLTPQQIQKLSQDILMQGTTPQQVMQQHQQGLKKQFKSDPNTKKAPQNLVTEQNMAFNQFEDPEKQDKNAKKPPSAFIIFSQEFRVKVKQRFPSLSQDQICHVVKEKWTKLTQEQRAPFEKRSIDAKTKIDGVMKPDISTSVAINDALSMNDDFLKQITEILQEKNNSMMSTNNVQQGIINSIAANMSGISSQGRPPARRSRRNSNVNASSLNPSQQKVVKNDKKKQNQDGSRDDKLDEISESGVNQFLNDQKQTMSKRTSKQMEKAQNDMQSKGISDNHSQKSVQGNTTSQQMHTQQNMFNLNNQNMQKLTPGNSQPPHSPQGQNDLFASLQNFKGQQPNPFLGMNNQNGPNQTNFFSGMTGQQQEQFLSNNQRNDQSNPNISNKQNGSNNALFPPNQNANALFAQNLGVNGVAAGQQFPQQSNQPNSQANSQNQNNWNAAQNFNFQGQNLPGNITPTSNQGNGYGNNFNGGGNPFAALMNGGVSPIDYSDMNQQAQVGNMMGMDLQQQQAYQMIMNPNMYQTVLNAYMGMAAPMMPQFQQHLFNQMQMMAQNPAVQAQAALLNQNQQHPQLMQRGANAPGVGPQGQQPQAQQTNKFSALASNTPAQENPNTTNQNSRAHSFSFSGNQLPGSQPNQNTQGGNQNQSQQMSQQQQQFPNNDNSGNNFLNGFLNGNGQPNQQGNNSQAQGQSIRSMQSSGNQSQSQSQNNSANNEMKQVSPQFAQQFNQGNLTPQNNLKDHDGGTLSQGEVGAHQEVSNAGPSSLYPSSHGQNNTAGNNTYGVSPVHMSSQPPSVLTGGFPDDTNFGLLQQHYTNNGNSMSHPQSSGILPDNMFFQANNSSGDQQIHSNSGQTSNQQSRQGGSNVSFNTNNLLNGGNFQNIQQQANAMQMFQNQSDYQSQAEGKSENATPRLTPSLQAQIPNKSQTGQNQQHQPQSPIGVNKDQFNTQSGNQLHQSFNPQ